MIANERYGYADSPWATPLSEAGVKWGECRALTEKKGVTFVLGNAYGLMPYQEPLAQMLAGQGLHSVWTSLPGQEGAKGQFSIGAVTDFIHKVIDAARLAEWDLSFVSHCASALGVLKTLSTWPTPAVRSIVVYGPLVNLSHLKDRALPLLRRAGVLFDLPEDAWELDLESLLRYVGTPALIAYSLDSANKRRASPEQIERLSALECVSRVIIRENGYDEDPSFIEDFFGDYVKFLRETLS